MPKRWGGERSLHHTFGFVSIKFIIASLSASITLLMFLDSSAIWNNFSPKYNVSILVSLILRVAFISGLVNYVFILTSIFFAVQFFFCWENIFKECSENFILLNSTM